MEIVMTLLAVLVIGSIVLLGLAAAPGKSESEDRAQYEHFNPSSKRMVEGRPEQPQPARVAESQRPTLVRDVMGGKFPSCREDQTVDEARRIMRERHVEFLIVMDEDSRPIGIIRMKDLDDKDRPESET